MNIEALKSNIISGQPIHDFIIFVCSESSFVAKQYIDAISTNNHQQTILVDTLSDLNKQSDDLFGSFDSDSICVMFIDSLSETFDITNCVDSFIVCKKVDKEVETYYNEHIVVVPNLEKWQITDYVYSTAEGIDTKSLDSLLKLCDYDIHRLDSELDKVKIFDLNERNNVFNMFIADNVFSDLCEQTIWTLSDAIIKRNTQSLSSVLSNIDKIDVEPIGLLTVLIQNFRNVIAVQLSSNPTPENCNLSTKQFWGVKYSCGFYNKSQLISIFKFLTTLDMKLKSGELPESIMIDYIITKIFSFV